jgi:hypothetical protein
MAIVSQLSHQGGEATFYDIPDDQLRQYALEKEQLTDDKKSEVFSGKSDVTRQDAQGVMPAAAMGGGDVQAYNQDICWVRYGRRIYWWYC